MKLFLSVGFIVSLSLAYAESARQDSAEPASKNELLTLSIKKGCDCDFVKCPAGSFTMGRFGDLEEQSPSREHKVIFTRPFWIMTKRVTWKIWRSTCKGRPWGGIPESVDTDNLPAFRVSYNDVQVFCDKMNKRFKAKLPKGCVIRLPTEAEWEYALNANCDDNDNPYVQFRDNHKRGDEIMVGESEVMKLVPQNDLKAIGEMKKQGLHKYLCPVGIKAPNSWGLYDMLANGGEMTMDVVTYGKFDFWEKAKLWGKVKYEGEETDPCKIDPWGDCYIARGTAGNQETHKGDWFGKDIMPISQSQFSQRGFRLVIGPDFVGEWKSKHSVSTKPPKARKK